ncbi:MAG: FecR domain-containing protein [Lachnospiraceae bacterium]|nr:FecR domain-containing protein [Lachnospiraceae bacterium]
MMQKLISNRKIIICACAAVVVAAVAVVALLANKEETYRSILVYDVEGNAVIERENVGAMNAAENLYLESGDRVSVASESSMRMKLDDDKYVMAEADTVFSVEAEGTDADSRTKISLEQGAITNEIQNPLSEGSRYETSTPNSVMAVRGTIYRVELYADGNGGQNTKLCCFQGKVGATPILPDGTYGEEILVPAGSELIIYQDGTVDGVTDIAYHALPLQAIVNLLGLMESGQDVTGISLEELTQIVSETEDVSDAAESEAGPVQQLEEEQTEAAQEASGDADQAADTQIHTKADTAKNVPVKADREKQNAPAVKPEAGQSAPQAPEMKPPKAAEPVNSGSVESGGTEGGTSQDETAGNDADDDKSDKDKKDKPKRKPAKPKTYTVTFMYQGRVFATQTVKQGETAAAPVLVPDQSGAWDFDFGTKIEANTTVSWK